MYGKWLKVSNKDAIKALIAFRKLPDMSSKNISTWLAQFSSPTTGQCFHQVPNTSVDKLPKITQFGQYVLKKFEIKRKSQMQSFMNEYIVGSLIDPKVGVKAHGFAMLNGVPGQALVGLIVMDHAGGGLDVLTITLREFLERTGQNELTKLNNTIRKTLLAFYKSVQVGHGDLHFDNIMVNLKKQNYKSKNWTFSDIVSVKIIDYGNILLLPQKESVDNLTIDYFDKEIEYFTKTQQKRLAGQQNLYGGKYSVSYDDDTNIPFRQNKVVYHKLWKHLTGGPVPKNRSLI
jgi:hypothetical protein